MTSQAVDVLVVGAGPAGLTAAATLRRYGAEVLVVERKARLSSHPRATVVSTRSMELLRSWGLEDEVRAGGIPDVEWLGLVTETLAGAAGGEAVPLGLPTKEQAAVLSPTAPLCAPQDHTEAVLLGYARSLGAVVELGCEVLRIDVGDDGAEALVRDGDRIRVVRARYVIGADGAHSVVRSVLGIEMDGPGAMDALSVSAAFRAPLWDLVGEPRYGLYPIVHPDVSSVFVPSARGDEWVFGVAAELMERPDEAEMTRLIRIAAGVPDLEPRIRRITTFTFAAEIAERFAGRSAFLIGDAAHRVTPRGGTGMNTAIADGFNLAWKLSWVLHGWTPESLLDTYETERRPVAEHNLARSLDPMGSRRSVLDEVRFDLGGRLPHLWIDTAAGRISSLDLLGPGLTHLAAGQLSSPSNDQSDRPPVAKHRLGHKTAAALGADQPGGVMLRPDGVVWDPPPSAALEAA
jgi:putative polyketide hydroxylase